MFTVVVDIHPRSETCTRYTVDTRAVSLTDSKVSFFLIPLSSLQPQSGPRMLSLTTSLQRLESMWLR